MLIDLWETVNPSLELRAYNRWRYSHPVEEWWRWVAGRPKDVADEYFESWAAKYLAREIAGSVTFEREEEPRE